MYSIFVGLTLILPIASAVEVKQELSKADTAAIAKVETEVLLAMAGNMGESVAELRQRIKALSPAARRQLNLSVRPGVFQWSFAGEHPAHQLQIGMLEYVVSSEMKNYETLLVVEGSELKRMRRFGPAFNKLRKRRPDVQIDVQLAWSKDGRVRTVDLWKVYSAHDAAKVNEFLRKLDANEEGLGAINLQADPAALPKDKSPAVVTITLRVPPKK